ncbi:MAG: hypothetical protein SGI89_15140 [bacterium]|nr:hypothetical protein [bacterium]
MKFRIKFILIILAATEISFSQQTSTQNNTETFNENTDKTSQTYKNLKLVEKRGQPLKDLLKQDVQVRFYIREQKTEYKLDLLGSIGSNINFGGFWDKYAVINFTPQVYLKPLKFISIYSNRYLSCFIPAKSLKENLKDFILQSVSVLAIDNTFKAMFDKENLISDLLSFAAKNLFINLLIKPSAKKSEIPVYESFYYSMRITF